MKDLVIIGAGDFGREIANVVWRINMIQKEPEWNLMGFLDDNESLAGTVIDGLPVIGSSSWLQNQTEVIYAICSIGTSKMRKKVIEKIINPNVKWATLIDPDAKIYAGSSVGEGSIVCGGSILAIATKVGKHCVINLNCTLGHDDIVDDYCVINPGVNVSGKVHLCTCVDLGTGCKVIQGNTICENTTIGAGGVVVREIRESGTYVGVPVRMI